MSVDHTTSSPPPSEGDMAETYYETQGHVCMSMIKASMAPATEIIFIRSRLSDTIEHGEFFGTL